VVAVLRFPIEDKKKIVITHYLCGLCKIAGKVVVSREPGGVYSIFLK